MRNSRSLPVGMAHREDFQVPQPSALVRTFRVLYSEEFRYGKSHDPELHSTAPISASETSVKHMDKNGYPRI